jgi:predicted  nucleic acid-binding Zn-ribbon protein
LKEQLILLTGLQKVDARIQEVQGAIRALPEKLAPAKQDLARLAELLQLEKDEFTKTEAWRREQEDVLRQEDDAIKKAKIKLQASKNTRDYAAASRELDNKRRSMAEREEEILKVIEALETSKTSIVGHERDVETLRQHVCDDETDIAAKVAELQSGIAGAVDERKTLAAKIDAGILERYQTVANRRGIAVVPVLEGACQGCHMRIPPQLVNILARHESLESCPSCQRLLYHNTMLAPSEASPPPSGDAKS